jgi:hypothetical protein
MSDQTPDPHDRRLRAALEAEADDVVAGPELLDRIRTAAASPGRRHPARWLLVAAAAVAVVGVGAVLLRDDDQAVDLSNDPTSTTDTEPPTDLTTLLALRVACEAGEVLDLTVYMLPDATTADVAAMEAALDADPRVTSARYLDQAAVVEAMDAFHEDALDPTVVQQVPSAFLVDLAGGADETEVRADLSDLPGVYGLHDVECLSDPVDPPPLGQRPALVVLVREDGWLVTVDLQAGDQRELLFGGDPNASTGVEEGGPSFIDSVDLSPDRRWVYFSTCCEPAVGQTFRVSVAGGDPERVGLGAHPRVSPDGRYVATGGSESVFVHAVTGGAGADPVSVSADVPCCPRSLAWSPDGSQLAVVVGTGAEGETPQVLLFGWDGTALTPRDTGKPDDPGSFVSWTPDGTLSVSSGGPVDDDRSLSQDASYRWLLWVDEAGVVREQAGHESGDRTVITGLPEGRAADW